LKKLKLFFCPTFARLLSRWRAGLPDFSWHNIPKGGKIYQIITTSPNGHNIYIPNDRKIFQVTIKYTIIFHSKALKNLPKLGFLVWKQTIWQPCWRGEKNSGDVLIPWSLLSLKTNSRDDLIPQHNYCSPF
jgi:hypothetical protein